MIRGIDSITISAGNATKLAEFYRETVGLKQTMEAEMGEKDKVFGFDVGGSQNFAIFDHSEVKGKNKNPERFLINFEVEGAIEAAIKKLEKKGVKRVSELNHIENYGKTCTFEDPEGNYFQLVQVRES